MTAGSDDFAFDALDWKIVDLLKDNGRITNQEIADRLDVPRASVGTRIQRMTEAGALRIVAAADFSAYDYSVLIALAIRVRGRAPEAVALELAELPAIFAVHLVTGAHQIEALIAVHDFAELSDAVMGSINGIAGIEHIDTCIATDVVYYAFDVGIAR
jgi:Lrp/AsnC family transcriptional regulator, leucine-responsive regulatory protein